MKLVRRFSSLERNDLLLKSQQCLWTTEGKIGLDYLVQQRRLSEGIIREFGLGYIPSDVHHQLAGRIIFPIYDPSNNLIALSSRQVNGSGDLPTYWHESYEKDFYLYGIHLAKTWMRKWKFAVMVEGQFDVIKMYDAGIRNVSGLCGTKFSDIQLASVYRYCEEIVVLMDTDSNQSGQKAASKIMGFRGSAGCRGGESICNDMFSTKISTLQFKEHIDPDEYVDKYGGSSLKSLIKTKLMEIRSSEY